MQYFNMLWNGEVGEVVEGSDWDGERDCMVIDGVDYQLGDSVGGIDEFLEDEDLSKMKLYKDGGYRGEGCYSGSIEVDGKMFSLDIMSDYEVCELIEVEEMEEE